MGGILDNPQPVPFRLCPDVLHDSRVSSIVHGDHSPAAGADLATKIFRIQIAGLRIHVHEHDRSSAESRGVSCGYKSDGWNQNFISRPQTQSQTHQVQRRGSAVHRDRVRGVDFPGKGFLELSHSGPRAQPAGLKDFLDCLQLFRAESGPEYRDSLTRLLH